MHINIWTRAGILLVLISGISFLPYMPSDPAGRGLANEPAKREEPRGKAGKAATDSFGDPLPPGAVARLGTVRFRHGNGVFLIAFSADGKKIVFGGSDGVDNAIRMVETSTGKELRTFDVKPGEKPCGMELSPDGKMLVIASYSYSKPEGAFVIMDTATGKELARIDGGKQASDVMVFSPDSKVLVTQEYQRIGNTNNFHTRMVVSDAPTGKLLHEFKGLEGKVSRPAFSPDGKRLAISISQHDKPREQTKGIFYDTTNWRAVQPMAERPLLVTPWACRHYGTEYLAYSPDGKLLVGGDWFSHLDFMKAETGELIERVQLQLVGASSATPIRSITFSPDGKMAVVSDNGVVTVWETKGTRKVLYNTNPHSVAVFSPTEPLLVTGGQQNEGRGSIPGYGYPLLRFWDSKTGKEILKNDAPARPVQLTHWLPDGKLLAVSPLENCYRLWDWHKSKQIAKVSLDEKLWVAWSAVSANGKLLAVSHYNGKENDETIQIFDLAAGKVIHRLESKYVRHPIGFTADGGFLLTSEDDNQVAIWDTSAGKFVRRMDLKDTLQPALKDFNFYASRYALSGDGKTLALQVGEFRKPDPGDKGDFVRPMRFYGCAIDITTGKKRWATILGPENVAATDPIAFSPDGKILAERLGQKVLLRNAATGALLRELKCLNEWYEWTRQANALAFTPDGKKLIAADLRNNIYVWNVATGKELQKFTGHRGRIFSVSVSPDGRKFATASEDSTVLIWQLDGG
jgi:WD40 repeat protein